jgi:hypothetical protein|nr:MAG TPA: hypothetical protein [Caudoviricetes sp.]
MEIYPIKIKNDLFIINEQLIRVYYNKLDFYNDEKDCVIIFEYANNISIESKRMIEEEAKSIIEEIEALIRTLWREKRV